MAVPKPLTPFMDPFWNHTLFKGSLVLSFRPGEPCADLRGPELGVLSQGPASGNSELYEASMRISEGFYKESIRVYQGLGFHDGSRSFFLDVRGFYRRSSRFPRRLEFKRYNLGAFIVGFI